MPTIPRIAILPTLFLVGCVPLKYAQPVPDPCTPEMRLNNQGYNDPDTTVFHKCPDPTDDDFRWQVQKQKDEAKAKQEEAEQKKREDEKADKIAKDSTDLMLHYAKGLTLDQLIFFPILDIDKVCADYVQAAPQNALGQRSCVEENQKWYAIFKYTWPYLTQQHKEMCMAKAIFTFPFYYVNLGGCSQGYYELDRPTPKFGY